MKHYSRESRSAATNSDGMQLSNQTIASITRSDEHDERNEGDRTDKIATRRRAANELTTSDQH